MIKYSFSSIVGLVVAILNCLCFCAFIAIALPAALRCAQGFELDPRNEIDSVFIVFFLSIYVLFLQTPYLTLGAIARVEREKRVAPIGRLYLGSFCALLGLLVLSHPFVRCVLDLFD